MWPWTRRDITPVGVDIDGSAVRLAQVEFRSGHPPAVTLSSRPLPLNARSTDESARVSASVGLVRRMLGEGGFVGRRAVACLPHHIVHLRTLRLVRDSSLDLDAAVRLQARSLFPFRPDQLQLHYIQAGQTHYGTDARDEVIVAGSARDEVERVLVDFDRAGIDIAALDLSPCAAYRSACWSARDEREIHAVLDIGRLASHVVIGKGTRVRFIKRIAVGADHLADAVSRRLDIPREDAAQLRRQLIAATPDSPDRQAIRRVAIQACRPVLEILATEVSGCLRYYCVSFRGRPVERLVTSGRDAADPQLRAVLSAAVSVPVRMADPIAGFDIRSGSATCDSTGWATAIGLAIKSASSAAGPVEQAVPQRLETGAATATLVQS